MITKDTKTIEKHLDLAKKAGIDGFIVSWWGINSFEDSVFEKLLTLAEKKQLHLTIYYETAKSRSNVLEDFSYILNRYSSSKAYLKYKGKPVIFIYGRVLKGSTRHDWEGIYDTLGKKGEEFFIVGEGFSTEVMKTFDGIHLYIPSFGPISQMEDIYKTGTLYSHISQNLFVATVFPGYDDTIIRKPGRVIERKNGKFYEDIWEIAIKAQPQWIAITSFNEWHEGTEIEPSKEHGDMYININAKYAELFKSAPNNPGRP